MTFVASQEIEPSLPVGLGIMLSRPDTTRTGLHVGILYQDSRDTLRVLDLAWHERLRNGDHRALMPFHWKACDWCQGEDLAAEAPGIRAYLEFVAEAPANWVPYGGNPVGTYFDGAGRYVSTDASHGLTCATFVARVFEGAGRDVVHLADWKAREDDTEWLQDVVAVLRKHSPERAEEVSTASIPYRLRPEEVAHAATSEVIPLGFDAVSGPACQLRALVMDASWVMLGRYVHSESTD